MVGNTVDPYSWSLKTRESKQAITTKNAKQQYIMRTSNTYSCNLYPAVFSSSIIKTNIQMQSYSEKQTNKKITLVQVILNFRIHFYTLSLCQYLHPENQYENIQLSQNSGGRKYLIFFSAEKQKYKHSTSLDLCFQNPTELIICRLAILIKSL